MYLLFPGIINLKATKDRGLCQEKLIVLGGFMFQVSNTQYNSRFGGFSNKGSCATVVHMEEDLDILIAGNLRRIRIERGWSQAELGKRLELDKDKISAYENGHIMMGKSMMLRFCKALRIEPWEFYWTENTPVVINPREQARIYRFREEEKLGIAEEIAQYEEYRIDKAKKRGKKSSTERMLEALDALESTGKKKRRSA